MNEQKKIETTLGPYRVLDLTDENGLICGKVFGEMGADVIKIEKPGGDPSRSRGPFYHDIPDPEKSLYWFAYNSCKRGITLDIERADGKEIFKKLVKSADFVVESFEPGYMESLGLGYKDLEKVNPGIIMIRITGFGQTGPFAHYKAPDIVPMAMGGWMYLAGDADRPPIRCSEPQAYLNAGVEGMVGALLALWHRHNTGEGQQVDVSAQACMYWTLTNQTGYPAVNPTAETARRAGVYRKLGPLSTRVVYPCKDGYVAYLPTTGVDASAMFRLVEWMDSEGMAGNLKNEDWSTWDVFTTAQENKLPPVEEQIAKFFATHTKQEIEEEAVSRRLMLYPISTPKDAIDNPQLKARDYWIQKTHPELGETITYPGAFAKMSEAPWVSQRRAPLIGEHNEEIYEKELGIPREKLLILRQAGVI